MPKGSPQRTLEQLRVVVTRPAHQAERLCRMIEERGGFVTRLPVLEITAPADIEASQEKLSRLENFSVAIFTSANAVDGLFQLVPTPFSWPEKLRVAAIGKRTAQALRERGIDVNIIPEQGFNSESLLQTTAMNDVADARIIILKGEGGRGLLEKSLAQRGATIETVNLYRRQKPNKTLGNIHSAGKSGNIDLFVVTSNEGLQNLFEMATENEREWLLKTALAVISERTAQLAATLGFSHKPVVAREASDECLVDSIEQWYAERFREEIQRGE